MKFVLKSVTFSGSLVTYIEGREHVFDGASELVQFLDKKHESFNSADVVVRSDVEHNRELQRKARGG